MRADVAEVLVIRAGDVAPDFTLAGADGEMVTLSRLRGSAVVLYFYPKDDTPGCTKEACAFNDALPRLTSAGALVVGVSPDTPASHARFRGKYGLGFALLSDPDKAVATRWGAFGEKLMYGRKVQGMIRSTFVIDAQGVVRKVFARVRVEGHAERVLEALAAL